MAGFNDLRRLANGASMVAKEAAKRSRVVETATSGDLAGTLKAAILTATDFVGLTSGPIRHVSAPTPKEPSVVYFGEESSPPRSESVEEEKPTTNLHTASETTLSIQTEPAFSVLDDKPKETEVLKKNLHKLNERSVESTDKMENKEELKTVAGTTSGEEQRSESSSVGAAKRRRPRERRVPSTPFTRAIGLVFSELLFSQV